MVYIYRNRKQTRPPFHEMTFGYEPRVAVVRGDGALLNTENGSEGESWS